MFVLPLPVGAATVSTVQLPESYLPEVTPGAQLISRIIPPPGAFNFRLVSCEPTVDVKVTVGTATKPSKAIKSLCGVVGVPVRLLYVN